MTATNPRTLYLAAPRGYSAPAWTARSTSSTWRCRSTAPPIYVRHEIVHNRHVVDDLRQQGRDLHRRPARRAAGRGGDLLRARRLARGARGGRRARLQALDATCPLVTKVHLEALRYAQEGYTIVLIGHRQHVEVHRHAGRGARRDRSWCETVADVEALELPDPATRGVHHADHALGGRLRAIVGCAAAAATRRSASRPRTTSATRRRTARTPCRAERRRKCDRAGGGRARRAATPTGWSRWRPHSAPRRT